jgi:hypothetical protein
MTDAVLEALSEVSNDAQQSIEYSQPYAALIAVTGTVPILFHRWSVEAVEAQMKGKKGSKVKKTDNVESYVYRLPDDGLAIPSEYFRMSLINASKFKQDPRSPRKSAMDIFKAGVACLEPLCRLGPDKEPRTRWDYMDQRRVMVQRQGITRNRPALNAGWTAEVMMQVLLPEYIPPQFLHEVMTEAGRLVGVGDFRPSYGRFQITSFQVV